METNKTQTATEYTEEERRTRIQNFFKVPVLKWPPIIDPHAGLMILGILMALALTNYFEYAKKEQVIATISFFVICLVFSAFQFAIWTAKYRQDRKIYNNRASNDELKAWIVKDIKEVVKPKSITTLSLNMEDIRPENFIIIPIPIYWAAPGIDESQVKRCPLEDGTYTYSMWRVQILVLTKHFISLFKCNFNWLDNSISSISTNEFYFQDITSIRNDMRTIEHYFVDNEEMPIGSGKVFCVTNFSGENLTVINDIPSLKVTRTVAVDLEYIVSLLRMVIRNRRFGITHEEMSTQEQQSIDGTFDNEDDQQETTETINSIEYLLNKRDDEMNQQESQFGGAPFSSFNDGNDIDSDATEPEPNRQG